VTNNVFLDIKSKNTTTTTTTKTTKKSSIKTLAGAGN